MARPVKLLSGFMDGLTNVVANLGTSRDKASATGYIAPMLADQDLINAYRGSWLPRKIVDIPALDSCRAWRNWQAEADQIEKLEAEEVRLGLLGKVLAARISARLFGGAAILIGTGDLNNAVPINPERIKAGGLKYLAVLHKRQLSPGPIDNDPSSPTFNEPSYWTINSNAASMVRIHPSRLVIFKGAQVPDESMSPTQPGMGDSVLLAVMDAIRNMDSASANVASLIYEAKVDTVGIPDLMNKLGDPAYEQTLLKRWALAETGKGINGTLMHDADEILGQKQASFNALPDVMDRFMQLASGAADIPMTRLLGQSPSGMSATGESDLRNYYDRISATQEVEMGPAMRVLDECLIRSALGARPDEAHYIWASLWQISDKERADIGKTQADTIVALRNTQLIPDQPLAEAAINALTETGALPGLEGAVTAWLAENPGEELGGGDDPEEIAAAQTMKNGAEKGDLTDAAPRTLYVRRNVLNADEIVAWAKDQGFKTTLPADDMHITIAFSRTPVDWMKVGTAWEDEMEIAAGGPRLMDRFGDARVLLVASSQLSWRHEEIKRAGASWDHPEYQPHITISYDAGSPDLSGIEPYRGKIKLGPEIFEEVKEDWAKGVREE